MQHGYNDNGILNSVHEEAERLKLCAETYDFVLNATSTGGGSNYPIPVPRGANRVEILVKVAGGSAGDLQVWRQVNKVTDPSGRPMQVIVSTLAYNANGTRAVVELPPDIGRLYAVTSGLTGSAQLSCVLSFWRVG